MRSLGLITLMWLSLSIGCAPTEQEIAPPQLTPERAKTALIAMMQNRDETPLCRTEIEWLETKEIESDVDGSSTRIGPISIDVANSKCTFMIDHGGCVSHYECTFELRGRDWIANPPRVKFQAFQGGRNP